MSDQQKTIRVSVYYWDKDVGHIAVKIGDKYTSFNPDKTRPIDLDREYKRTDVPGMGNTPVIVRKFHGKLVINHNDDIKMIGKLPAQAWHFSIPHKEIDVSTLYKPVRATYQLVDNVKGDNSHNNCVNYVRQELFIYINSDEIKRKLVTIHRPIDFFNALKAYDVMNDMQATEKILARSKVS